MKVLATILVRFRLLFFVASIVAAAFCAQLIPEVVLNSDQTKYLDKESSMAQGLEIINNEFPAADMRDSFQVMFENLTPSEKLVIYEQLAQFDGVTGVDYDIDSHDYNTKNYTMYRVHTEYLYDSDSVGAIIDEVKDTYSDYKIHWYYSGATMDVLDVLLPMAGAVMIIVLFILCKSYIEPLLLIIGIGVAILINMGSNVIFESVSDMTFAIAAVFQLALSIDYSIMLLHRYKQEYDLLGRTNKPKAMINAIVNAISSICSSSFTTIVGLLVLLLMSFTVGRDIGLVISKGVFFSLVCVFTVSPTTIMLFSGLVYKLDKQAIKEKRLARRGGRV